MTIPVANIVHLLKCPASGAALRLDGASLVSSDNAHRYRITEAGTPLFAETLCSTEGRVQQTHYDRVAQQYIENLTYPHTEEYSHYLDQTLLSAVDNRNLGTIAEVCCGRGEAFRVLDGRFELGVGVDVSLAMVEAGQREMNSAPVILLQGDATMLPLADSAFDNVVTLNGVHHVNNRGRFFGEIYRVLKPGGRLYWREPVSDLFLWRWLRYLVYRFSSSLDFDTEHPLRYHETASHLASAGFQLKLWRTYGLIGFMLFMNSDVLVFNRLFRFIPGIRRLTRLAASLDDLLLRLPGLGRKGLQVIGVAEKPVQ